MANLGRQQLSSRQVANRKQNKNLFEPQKFSAPNRDLNSPSATTDLPSYRQPQSGDIIANVRRTLEAGTAQTPAFDHKKNNELTALRQDSLDSIPVIQPKLTIGRPDDKYEREADRVAASVVKQINNSISVDSVQGQATEKEADSHRIQRFSTVQREAIAGGEASTELTSAINSARGSGQPLDAKLQQSIGQAMGADFSRVRVHTDRRSDSLNRSIQAKAFTTGQDVFFRQGAYQPGSPRGQQLIAHELTHVVQQSGNNKIQRVMQGERGVDPVEAIVKDLKDGKDNFDLLYGFERDVGPRVVTTNRLKEKLNKESIDGSNMDLIKIDQYNKAIKLNLLITKNKYSEYKAAKSLFLVREALKQNDVQGYKRIINSKINGAGLKQDNNVKVGKWIEYLQNHRHKIGLYDLGEKGKNWYSRSPGKAKIKQKGRFQKNLSDAQGNLTVQNVYNWLRQDITYEKAVKKFDDLNRKNPQKASALNSWIMNEFWRRTSKLGIDFTIENKGKIHFNLAGENKEKTHSNSAGENKKKLVMEEDRVATLSHEMKGNRPITVSEYRHILKLMRDPAWVENYRHQINFYNEWKEVEKVNKT